MDRRRPGKALTTMRSETDQVTFLTGLLEGKTTGYPITLWIANQDQRSRDYKDLAVKPRPSHADYTAQLRYGKSVDLRGGGHFSGRLTAGLCAAGGMALQYLREQGIALAAYLSQVGSQKGSSLSLEEMEKADFSRINRNFPAVEGNVKPFQEEIAKAKSEADSVGGVIECVISGLPGGLGSPIFDGLENLLARALFGIPGVKGLEFGSGFSGITQRGSEQNDPFIIEEGEIRTKTNHSGGIQGGITNGMPVVFRLGMKPTASIGLEQDTVDLEEKKPTKLTIKGRHDPCIAVRAVPVVEAVAALVVLDLLLTEGGIPCTDC